MPNKYLNKKLVIFDLDNTLTESKTVMDPEMSELLEQLLEKKYVAVMSGGSLVQFHKQFISGLIVKENLISKLHLCPTCGATLHTYQNGWKQIYGESLTDKDKADIYKAFDKALPLSGYLKPDYIHGELLEDRITQVSFSALGQEAPAQMKAVWDQDQKKRLKIVAELEKLLPQFEIRIGGGTSIDVTSKGIDKAFGTRKLMEFLKLELNDVVFVGDMIFPGGNDYPVKLMGVETIEVAGPSETKAVIRNFLE